MDVVIFNEDEIAFEFAVFAQMNDVLDVAFALVIARMGFASENELDGPRGVPSEPHDILELLEDERRSFVSGKPTRKTDSQSVRIEQLIERDKVPVGQP